MRSSSAALRLDEKPAPFVSGVFDLPSVEYTVAYIQHALRAAQVDDTHHRHWYLSDTLPESVAANVLMLPICPALNVEYAGARDASDNNAKRTYFSPQLQRDYPVVALLSEALQRPDMAAFLAGALDMPSVEGSYLRIEYVQDTNGAWLKPHSDIKEKLFTMLIYLCTGPEAGDWGTDLYDDSQTWYERADSSFNSALIFKFGMQHGLERRPIHGVRRMLAVNYVDASWRDKDQLCFPDRPITLMPATTKA